MVRFWARAALGLVPFGFGPCLDAQGLDRPETGREGIAEVESPVPTVFEGIIVDTDGAPAEGAVVVSSAGGKTLTDASGSYRLEVSVPLAAHSVEITAVGGGSGNLVASTSVQLPAGSALARVGPLWLSSGTCQPSWLPTFGGMPGVSAFGGFLNMYRVFRVAHLTVFDDGSGPALFVCGNFMTAGGAASSYIAKWDGSSWSALGSWPDDDVLVLEVFDDGSGPALYAGGKFTTAGGVAANGIAKWNGSSWAALGSGVNGSVDALTVFDDGNGPALYAGGYFATAGGVAANFIAKWDGSTWTPLGGGMNSAVLAIEVFDDGSGPALYAGGGFSTAGGVAANGIAKWNGSSWAALGTGVNGSVGALTVFDDGIGPALYAGGCFSTAGGVAASFIARWDGTSWTALGSGTNYWVNALTVFDDGSGPALYAGGSFTTAGGVAANYIAKWDGSNWTALGSGVSGTSPLYVVALTVFDDGSGPALYAGGNFMSAGGVLAIRIAKWDGSSWTALGKGMNDAVQALTVFDDGGGPALYAGGRFTIAGGVALNYVAKWEGSSWASLGSGMNYHVYALEVFDDGGGPALYAGGDFTTAGGVAANHIAKWDGSTWAALGSGMNSSVNALTVFDDGSGPALYAGGFFTTAGAVAAGKIAKWDGASWAALGSGMSGSPYPGVVALTGFDDGGGPALYAGGYFTSAGGVAANYIAKWDGSTWTPLGSGVSGPLGLSVNALTVFDDGGGPALHVGGNFTSAGGVAANLIAKWDGSSWAALGSGMTANNAVPGVWTLAVFDDGSGSALYAGGEFTTAGGMTANRIARWDGSNWSALGTGTTEYPWAMTVFNDRTGQALFVGGFFKSAPDSEDSFLAKWGCPDTNPPTLSCPASIVVDDRPERRGEIVTFTVTAADEEDPTPSVVCVPPSGSLFPRGTTLVTCTATDFAGNPSICRFPVTVRFRVDDR